MYISRKWTLISLAATVEVLPMTLLLAIFLSNVMIVLTCVSMALWFLILMYCNEKMRCPSCGKRIMRLNALYIQGNRKIHCVHCGTEIEIR